MREGCGFGDSGTECEGQIDMAPEWILPSFSPDSTNQVHVLKIYPRAQGTVYKSLHCILFTITNNQIETERLMHESRRNYPTCMQRLTTQQLKQISEIYCINVDLF